MWHDPLQEMYYKLDVLDNKNVDVEVRKKGDADNDGICDDWDTTTRHSCWCKSRWERV